MKAWLGLARCELLACRLIVPCLRPGQCEALEVALAGRRELLVVQSAKTAQQTPGAALHLIAASVYLRLGEVDRGLDVARTVGRVTSLMQSGDAADVRERLADNLKGIIAQRLSRLEERLVH